MPLMRRKLVESVRAALRSWFRHRPVRRRFGLEALEPRLLLSADLMPAEGVLEIFGTEADDTVLIREVEAQSDAGSRLEVLFNGQGIVYDLEDLRTVKLDLSGGDDQLDIRVDTPLEWSIDVGEGDNTTLIRFGDGEHGARPPSGASNIAVEYRSGSGNDQVALELTHVVQQDDAPAATVALSFLTGLGADAVDVAAKGAFDQFDLSVDLGADAAANEIRTEALTLAFEEIRVDYRAHGMHGYQAGAGSDRVDARYDMSLRSDGERVEASHMVETVGGLVSDHVDIQVGGTSTESVGSLATVSVGSRGDTVDHKETITIHANRAGLVSAEVLTGAADDSVDVHVFPGEITSIEPGFDAMALELTIRTGAGDDQVGIMFNPKEYTLSKDVPWQADVHVDLGTGADRLALDWRQGGGEWRTSLLVEMGGADPFGPEIGDEVLIAFEHGDPRAPVIIGGLWNSQDAPPETQERKSLELDMASTGARLTGSVELRGGSASDRVALSFEGKRGAANGSPIDIAVHGGQGDDAIVVTGTERPDFFLVRKDTIRLHGWAAIWHEGFEDALLEGGLGNDRMIVVKPTAPTTLDGGPGKDILVEPRLGGREIGVRARLIPA